MSQTGFIILIILFVAAMLLLFWWMTRQPGGTRDGSGSETAAALGSLVPDEGGDTSPPATIRGESIAPDPLPVVTPPPPPPLPTPLPPVAESPVAPAAPPERDIGIVAPQAADGAVDNLLLMKGVGPKLAARLGELGVTRFDQIAGWTDADIDRVDAELGTFRGRIRRDQWVDQAGYLARGDHKGFAAKYGNI